jgi:hypothetical protein
MVELIAQYNGPLFSFPDEPPAPNSSGGKNVMGTPVGSNDKVPGFMAP